MRYLLLGLCVALCMAQSPGNQIIARYALTGDNALSVGAENILLDPPLTLTRDSTKYKHMGVKLPGAITFSSGFITATLPDGSTQVFLDTSYVMYRSPIIPTGPGTCQIGTGGMAADSQFAYFCVPNPDAQQGAAPFIWGRVPVQTIW